MNERERELDHVAHEIGNYANAYTPGVKFLANSFVLDIEKIPALIDN